MEPKLVRERVERVVDLVPRLLAEVVDSAEVREHRERTVALEMRADIDDPLAPDSHRPVAPELRNLRDRLAECRAKRCNDLTHLHAYSPLTMIGP